VVFLAAGPLVGELNEPTADSVGPLNLSFILPMIRMAVRRRPDRQHRPWSDRYRFHLDAVCDVRALNNGM
jgi:hypothetical protein